MAKEIPAKIYTEIRELAGAYDVSVQDEYSGRNMNGESCFGMNGELKSLICFTFQLGQIAGKEMNEEENSEFYRMFAHMRMDDMGRDDVIFYFPGYGPGEHLRHSEDQGAAMGFGM